MFGRGPYARQCRDTRRAEADRSRQPARQPSADEADREAEVQEALPGLRAAVAAASPGEVQGRDNVKKAQHCLALALFCAACDRMRAKKAGGPTRELLQEAVALAPGLHKERREEARRYLAYATYAAGKEKLQKREFGAAMEHLDAVLDPEGELVRWLDVAKQQKAKRYLADCEASLGVQELRTVQEWIDARPNLATGRRRRPRWPPS